MLHAAGLLTNCCVSELAPLASTGQIDNDDIRIKKVLAILFKHLDNLIPPTWDAAVTELAKCLRYNEAFHNCVSQLSDEYANIRDVGVGPTALFTHRLQLALHCLASIGRIPFMRGLPATAGSPDPNAHVSSGTGAEGSTPVKPSPEMQIVTVFTSGIHGFPLFSRTGLPLQIGYFGHQKVISKSSKSHP